MSAEAIVTVSAVVVTLVQLAKWAGLREVYGPAAVLGFSLLGVAVWVLSEGSWPPGRTDVWPIFSGCIAVATSAAGVFGFTRAAVGAVTRATPPSNEGDAITEAAIRIRAKRLEREHPNALVSKPPQWLPPTPRYGASSVPQLSDDEIVRRHEALG
jgi:hypothetical protein